VGLIIVAVGQRMPAWVGAGFAEYAKRMPPDLRVELKEIKAQHRSGGSTSSILSAEAERIRQALPKRYTLIALDERGEDLSSTELAARLTRWREIGDPVVFLIGSADGLDVSLKSEAALLLKLSSFTLPHGLARVMLAEQLYRASSIIENHPYHRA
jgi:23S rRNA (pseudouridine1915-N3)-methyltransferase